MNAGWYYMASGWLRKPRRVGPLSDSDLLLRIDEGKIAPETLLLSEKTRGKWVPMKAIGPAMKRWESKHPENKNAS